MKNSKTKNNFNRFNRHSLFLFFISLAALTTTFLFASSSVSFQTKFAAFLLIIITYLVMYLWQNQQVSTQTDENNYEPILEVDVEPTLQALDETNQFLSSALKSADMFRLVASRVKEVVPFVACVLYMADEKKEKLKIVYSIGENLKKINASEIDSGKGLAGKVFQDQQTAIDETLALDKTVFPAEILKDLTSAIAIPLLRNETAYGVFVLYGGKDNKFDRNSLQIFEAIGSRIAPLFLSSQAFENSLNNALTDALTNLPNERAFYLVLENQIAESQRFRDQRPLTILVIDIKDFAEHNQRLGHVIGDRLLLFVTEKVKLQLRQMDFLARSVSDEFLVVLPTASENIAREITERIEKTFVTSPFEVSNGEKIYLQLSFGAASFGKDGETANQLLKHALLRKKQSKIAELSSKILWFPKEFVN